eukprot:TRINITY_DN20168_c1_g1_i1.p1 TRINITY_DN20168_c1_g1~~TRINITY_DN20168_c1_g1_i1.p1  ORF type:complete len:317 (-),score=57.16 TRINITY_DN20168_c1_g1_i1:88-993(-)
MSALLGHASQKPRRRARIFNAGLIATGCFVGLERLSAFCAPTPPAIARSAYAVTSSASQWTGKSLEQHSRLASSKSTRQVLPELALPTSIEQAQALLDQLPEYVQSMGPSGPILYWAVFVLFECLSLPASPLLLSSGYVFGLQFGIALSITALITAATISFALAKTILRPQLMKFAAGNETFQNINAAVKVEGFKIIFLLRLAPLLPFAISNYAYGLSEVGFVDYIVATALGCAPGTCAFVYFASAAKDMGEGGGSPWYVYAGGILATFVLLKVVADVAQKAVEDSVGKSDASSSMVKEVA